MVLMGSKVQRQSKFKLLKFVCESAVEAGTVDQAPLSIVKHAGNRGKALKETRSLETHAKFDDHCKMHPRDNREFDDHQKSKHQRQL